MSKRTFWEGAGCRLVEKQKTNKKETVFIIYILKTKGVVC